MKKYSVSKIAAIVVIVCFYYFIFPKFLRGIWVFPQEISLGPLGIKVYSIFILSAILIPTIFIARLARKYKGIDHISIDELFVWTLIPGIICARLWHVITDWHLYASEPINALYIWNGGLGIFGGMIGGAIGMYLYTKLEKINFIRLIDCIAIYIPLGQIIGRFGNFANQEIYGPITDLPWGQYIARTGEFHHPAFLYEQIGNSILFLILQFVYRKRKLGDNGLLICLYFIGYGTVRFLVDIIRSEPNVLGPFSIAQVTSIVLICIFSGYLVGRYLIFRYRK